MKLGHNCEDVNTDTSCRNRPIPYSSKWYAVKANSQERRCRDERKESNQRPRPSTKCPVFGRHKAQNEKAHREPYEEGSPRMDHNYDSGVFVDILNV